MDEILGQFQKDYQFRIRSKGLKAYLHGVNQFLVFVEKPFNEISKRDIRNWLMQLTEKGYKPKIALKTFYRYCWEEGFIHENLAETIPFPKVEESIPRYLSRQQLTQLREIAEGIEERALIEMLYSTGVRISELRAMKKEDINWSERSILIPNGKGKRARIVLFNAQCEEYLKGYLDSRTDDLPYVFVNAGANKPFAFTKVNERFREYSKQLGFPVKPHMLRHTFAAHLAQKGMPLTTIQTLLGHEHPQTTQLYARLYDHARKEMYDEWM